MAAMNDSDLSNGNDLVDFLGNGPEQPALSAYVDIAAATHEGFVREINEDHYLVIRFHRTLENVFTNIPEQLLEKSFDIVGYCALVADGVGGHAGGEVASRLALTNLIDLVVATPDWIMSLRRSHDAQRVLNRMTERFLEVDEKLRTHARRHAELQGMGTTLTIAGLLGDELIIGHIGDSRAYLFRDGRLMQLTSDHTLAQRLIDAGVAKPNDAVARSMRHVLTAALGSLGEEVPPEVHRRKVVAGDQLLLCTDGLTDCVSDAEISSVFSESQSARWTCQQLMDLALSAGGVDNITAVVTRLIPSPPETSN
jgi:protein phosphatase